MAKTLRILLLALLLGVAGVQSAWAQANAPGNALGDKSDTDYWRDVRQGARGFVNSGDPRAAQLIQSEGEAWRNLRNGPLSTWGGWLLVGVLVAIAVYFAARRRIPIEGGRSGLVVPRFSLLERVVHWFAALTFVGLALSGLAMLFGKHVLLPLMGKPIFAAIASLSLTMHNLFGPLFVPAIVAMILVYARGNFFQWVDLKWILKGGGFFGGHPSSFRYNFGEKTWYWFLVVFGLAASATGLSLSFPGLVGDDRTWLQVAVLVHAVSAILLMAFALGHIYLATLGMEGALEGMTRGTVDVAWAKQHHDLWYEQVKQQATPDTDDRSAPAGLGTRGAAE